MILINNLCGPFDSETSEGRGANAAYNVIKYLKEGKKILDQKAKQYMNGEISLQETTVNKPLETLASAYIPYMPVDEETGKPDFKYGLAYAAVYISAFDKDQKGYLTQKEAGPFGEVMDFVAPYGKITAGKVLSWLIFQDCTDVYNGVISPKEACASLALAKNDFDFVREQLNVIYKSYEIEQFETDFTTPHPITQ
jgi:hypothetical protein